MKKERKKSESCVSEVQNKKSKKKKKKKKKHTHELKKKKKSFYLPFQHVSTVAGTHQVSSC